MSFTFIWFHSKTFFNNIYITVSFKNPMSTSTYQNNLDNSTARFWIHQNIKFQIFITWPVMAVIRNVWWMNGKQAKASYSTKCFLVPFKPIQAKPFKSFTIQKISINLSQFEIFWILWKYWNDAEGVEAPFGITNISQLNEFFIEV